MGILFCNIAWMKYYNGVTDDDRPKNGGAYVDENEYGNECFNFQDYNGKCYGFVMTYGDMRLELHYKEAKKNTECLRDMLVIWVATNDRNETRIVGWYKNATVYRQRQFKQSFTSEEHNLYYNIVADAKDCYLLPEDQRTFAVQRAAKSGKGTGMGRSNVWYAESTFAKTVLIPQVMVFIEGYKGSFDNSVYTESILGQTLEMGELSEDFQALYDGGVKCFEGEDFVSAIKLFNTARLIAETPELLVYTADSLLSINCFDRAISVYNRALDLGGNAVAIMQRLMLCYDYKGDGHKTIECCSRIIELLDDSKESIDEKIYCCFIMFYIYVSLGDEKNAKAVINRISSYPADDEVKKHIQDMKDVIKSEFEMQQLLS